MGGRSETVVTIQARSSSHRLPGKVLTPLAGRPMIDHLVDRMVLADVGPVVVATSDDPSDDVLAGHLAGRGVAVHRGPLDHVARRLLDAGRAAGAERIVRVSGDSPLLDHRLVVAAVTRAVESGADLVTNVFPRSFPAGQSVEVVAIAALAAAVEAMALDRHIEHVTTWFYDDPTRHRIVNLAHDPDVSHLHLTVDEPDDLVRIERLFAAMTAPPATYSVDDLVALVESA